MEATQKDPQGCERMECECACCGGQDFLSGQFRAQNCYSKPQKSRSFSEMSVKLKYLPWSDPPSGTPHHESKGVDHVALIGFSEVFDNWMKYKRGEIESPPTINLKVPDEIQEILGELRKRDDDGARWIAFALLGMPDSGLGAIAQMVREVRAAQLTPGMFRRVTHQEGDTVISLVASLDLPSSMLRERTIFRTGLEKYRRKALRSIGIGIMVGDQSQPFYSAIWMEGHWKYDEAMEKALDHEPDFVPANGEKLPGRNAPCICGSGKKFKKCCLPKIDAARRKGIR